MYISMFAIALVKDMHYLVLPNLNYDLSPKYVAKDAPTKAVCYCCYGLSCKPNLVNH